MKKITLLFIVMMLIPFITKAQITITQSDMPVAGTYVIEVIDTICTNVSKGNAGASQTWNLANISNQFKDTSYWASPSTIAGASYFPTATIAQTQNGDNSFIKLSNTAFEMQGFYGDYGSGFGTQASIFTPAYKSIQLPSTYQTTYSGVYNFEIKVAYPNPPIDSMKISFAVNYTTLVDGWGNVTTPAFSNVPSLRQKNYAIATISGSMHIATGWIPSGTPSKDTSINYIWLSNQQKFTLANLTVDPNGTVTEATYLKATGIGTGINEISKQYTQVELFPNPASDIININGITQNAILIIFDANGRLITNKLLKNYKNTINVSNNNNGIYYYQILDMNGQSIGNGKFTVAK